MLTFGVAIPATVPQWSEIPEGLMNNPVHFKGYTVFRSLVLQHLAEDNNSGTELKEDKLREVSFITYEWNTLMSSILRRKAKVTP
jgi:hypothetical protein